MTFEDLAILLTIHFVIVTTASIIEGDLFYSILGGAFLVLTWCAYAWHRWKLKQIYGDK